jgi:hypothetical protein
MIVEARDPLWPIFVGYDDRAAHATHHRAPQLRGRIVNSLDNLCSAGVVRVMLILEVRVMGRGKEREHWRYLLQAVASPHKASCAALKAAKRSGDATGRRPQAKADRREEPSTQIRSATLNNSCTVGSRASDMQSTTSLANSILNETVIAPSSCRDGTHIGSEYDRDARRLPQSDGMDEFLSGTHRR